MCFTGLSSMIIVFFFLNFPLNFANRPLLSVFKKISLWVPLTFMVVTLLFLPMTYIRSQLSCPRICKGIRNPLKGYSQIWRVVGSRMELQIVMSAKSDTALKNVEHEGRTYTALGPIFAGTKEE